MLTNKQQLFVNEYLIDLNATQSAIRAGYSAKTAQEQSSRLLSNVIIAKKIQEALDKRSNDLGIDAKYVLTTIKETIERCKQAVPVTTKEGETTGEYKFDSAAVLKGSELLGKHLKMFTDKIDVGGQQDNPFVAINMNPVRPHGR